MKAMTISAQKEHDEAVGVVRSCVSSLRLLHLKDEDVRVALARLEDWLSENDGRWVA